MFTFIFRTDNNPALFIIRLALGVVMFAHGAQKALGWYGGAGLEKTIQIFSATMHFPPSLTIFLIIVEFFGSLGLIAGFLTRLSALGIGTLIAVCAYFNHLQNGFFMNWFGLQKGEGFEFHILVIGMAIALLIKGGGFLSLDNAFSRAKRR